LAAVARGVIDDVALNPHVNSQWLLMLPHCHCKRNKLSTLSPINISIAILLGFLLFVFLLLVSFPS
jgi:hypothetical protein